MQVLSETASDAVGGFASIVGTFVFDQYKEDLFVEDSWYVIVHHWDNNEPVTSVVEVKSASELGIRIRGEAVLYPFAADRTFLFDALPYEEAEVTVFNASESDGIVAAGPLDVQERTAYDLDSGSSFPVVDIDFMPANADLYFDDRDDFATMINGAEAVSRHGIPPSAQLCASIDDEAWRSNMVRSGLADLEEAWCIRTVEGRYGSVKIINGQPEFEIWAEVSK